MRWNERFRSVLTRRAALALVATSGAAQVLPAWGQRPSGPTPPEPIEVAVRAIPAFDLRSPQKRRFGALDFRGGLKLSSSAKAFGGISSLRVDPDGQQFLAVTDRGYWLRGKIVYAETGPAGIAEAEMAPMLGFDGRTLSSRGWYDTESLARDGPLAFVGIERVHQIVRFDYGRQGLLARGEPITLPAEIKTLPRNQGIEALVAVPKGLPLAGTLIAISERGLDEAGNILGFLIGGKSPGSFAIRRSHEFDITDAAISPAGGLYILERRFSLLGGIGMRIRRLPLTAFTPGAVLDGPVLIEADHGAQIDNMEGLSIHPSATGELILTLVSDDNFSSLQRTLLLQFAYVEP